MDDTEAYINCTVTAEKEMVESEFREEARDYWVAEIMWDYAHIPNKQQDKIEEHFIYQKQYHTSIISTNI